MLLRCQRGLSCNYDLQQIYPLMNMYVGKPGGLPSLRNARFTLMADAGFQGTAFIVESSQPAQKFPDGIVRLGIQHSACCRIACLHGFPEP